MKRRDFLAAILATSSAVFVIKPDVKNDVDYNFTETLSDRIDRHINFIKPDPQRWCKAVTDVSAQQWKNRLLLSAMRKELSDNE